MALSSYSVLPGSRRRHRPLARCIRYQSLRPIARFTADPTVLAVRADAPWKTVKDFVEDAKKRPGAINYGSSGNYGTMHVPMEILAQNAGVKMTHVPFTGAGPAVVALLGGQIDAVSSGPATVLQHVKAGKLRVLATGATASWRRCPTCLRSRMPATTPSTRSGPACSCRPARPSRWCSACAPPPRGRQRPQGEGVILNAGSPVLYQDTPDFEKYVQADVRAWPTSSRRSARSNDLPKEPPMQAPPFLRWLAAGACAPPCCRRCPPRPRPGPPGRSSIVVPFATGGPADVYARFLAQRLPDAARPGLRGGQPARRRRGDRHRRGGQVAARRLHAAADVEHAHVNETLVRTSRTTCCATSSAWRRSTLRPGAGGASLGAGANVRELLKLAKERPGKLNYASSGTGTPYHMAGELFKSMSGTYLVHIPYKGSSGARTDVIGGQVDLMFDAVTTMTEQVKAGKVKAIATTGKQRSACCRTCRRSTSPACRLRSDHLAGRAGAQPWT
jgi:tripartite-type tricarboxylate transporter receptor subunit TctC